MPGVTVRIENDLSEIVKVHKKLDDFADQFRVPLAVARTFHIVFDDLLDNVISAAAYDL